jgi:hypothetical protein
LARQESQLRRLPWRRRCVTKRLFTRWRLWCKWIEGWRFAHLCAEKGGECRLAARRGSGARRHVRGPRIKVGRLAPFVCILPPGAGGVIGIVASARGDERKIIGALHADQFKPIADVNPHRLGY